MKTTSKKKKNQKTSKTTTVTEFSTPKKNPNFPFILKMVTDFFIYFPNNNIEQENYENKIENEENNNKIKIKKNSK